MTGDRRRRLRRPWLNVSAGLAFGVGPRRLFSLSGQQLQCLAARGDAQLVQQVLHVGANGVVRDEQALGDLVRAEMLVEEEQHLELARAEPVRDVVRHGVDARAAIAHLVEKPARDLAGELRLAADEGAHTVRENVASGLVSSLEYRVTENALLTTRSGLLDAVYQHNLAVAEWDRATGRYFQFSDASSRLEQRDSLNR